MGSRALELALRNALPEAKRAGFLLLRHFRPMGRAQIYSRELRAWLIKPSVGPNSFSRYALQRIDFSVAG